ncbi:MAG: phosphonoacetate hydrolase [Hyphomicrobiaceae bacterium]
MTAAKKSVTVNGREYRWPTSPLVVICCDGSEPAYIESAIARGLMPNIAGIIRRGADLRGDSVIPSFTNPNNLSIVTGRPPSYHGISGNFFVDPETGKEVMMNHPRYLRAPTIFKAFQQAGATVAVVTAKDKLRLLLGDGLTLAAGRAVCFSSEKADTCTLQENGIEKVLEMMGRGLPDVYSLELSEFVLAAGVKLMAKMRPDIMYLSTTDYIQHKHAPGSAGADAFYVMLDRHVGELDASGAVIVLTADHGMKDKHLANGEPDVLYLQDYLDNKLGKGRSRVILPITDPYVAHHGALGSFATVYLDAGLDVAEVCRDIAGLAGIHEVTNRAEGCRRYELPEDRLGDLIVISRDSKVVGTSASNHDLSQLDEPLRSHGGITEQTIPIIVNRRLRNLPDKLRNFDAFAIGLNHVVAG